MQRPRAFVMTYLLIKSISGPQPGAMKYVLLGSGTVTAYQTNTGASYGTHLHLEVHVNGQPTDPIPFLRDRGVDIKLQVESVYAGMAAAAS